jgi:hypothetical protein
MYVVMHTEPLCVRVDANEETIHKLDTPRLSAGRQHMKYSL